MDQIWFAEKNVTLITTDLKGTDVADIYADFKFSEDGKEIISCPAGHRPKSNVYDINTQKCNRCNEQSHRKRNDRTAR